MSGAEVLGYLRRFTNVDGVWIDNTVFRLHHQATFIFFLCASTYTCTNYKAFEVVWNNPISCIINLRGELEGKLAAVNSYCWIHSTYSVPTR